ncbi:hypothetical protein Hanom_Chr04g00359861 [Helianthus anomalus]
MDFDSSRARTFDSTAFYSIIHANIMEIGLCILYSRFFKITCFSNVFGFL